MNFFEGVKYVLKIITLLTKTSCSKHKFQLITEYQLKNKFQLMKILS